MAAPAGGCRGHGDARYATDTFTLVTRWTTADGEVEVTELMPVRDGSDARGAT